MADGRHTLEIPLDLPDRAECTQCVSRLEAEILATKGVAQVEPGPRRGSMTVSFDTDLLTVRGLEDRVRDTCGRLTDAYGHESLVLGGLDCADCARTIERSLSRHEGVLHSSVNFASSRLFVEYERSATDVAALKRVVTALGYEVWTDDEYRARRRREAPRPFYLRNRRALETAASFLLLILGSALWLLTPDPRIAAKVALLGAVVAGGRSVARNGLATIRNTRTVDMNVLMSVAIVGAVAIGEWVEAALVVALFGLGETLEGWAVERTRGSIQQLMEMTPDEATVRHADGREERVAVEKVTLGSLVVVKPGGRIPLDGVVSEGRSSVDESPITGESMPQDKTEGALVYAGTVNQHGSLLIRTSTTAGDSTLARLIALVEEAQGQKAPSERWVDGFARYYTPAVMVIAALTAVTPPLLLGADWGDWVYRALALLILACPCALVISTPVSIVAAIGAASRQGVLIKGGAHLEAAGGVKVVAFDKTGTLTFGLPRVTSVTAFGDATPASVLAAAAVVERDSEHPIAEAIVHAAAAIDGNGGRVRDFLALPGLGARGRLDEVTHHVGNTRLLEQEEIPVPPEATADVRAREARGETAVLVAADHAVIGVIGVADQVRPEAARVTAALREAGIETVVMLTGDNRATAAAVAREVGIEDYRAELLPHEKLETIRSLLHTHGSVAMVGDGINDAPALAAATVGVAMGAAGTDAALETADVALMADDLTRVPFTIRLSRAARTTVRQNIAFALGLKVLTTLLVFPGLLTLWMAVLADTGGSLIVIVNGLRLLRQGRDLGPSAVGLPERSRRETEARLTAPPAADGCACDVPTTESGAPRPAT